MGRASKRKKCTNEKKKMMHVPYVNMLRGTKSEVIYFELRYFKKEVGLDISGGGEGEKVQTGKSKPR